MAVGRLLAHGVTWLSLAVVMDFFTSGVMTRLRGAEAEGNLTVRAMFENPNVTTIGVAIEQQYIWLGLMIFGLLCSQLLKQERRIHNRRLRELAQTLCTVGVVLVWPFAVLRLYSGAVGNLLQIVAVYGMGAQVMIIVFGAAATLVAAADFLAIWPARRKQGSPCSKHSMADIPTNHL